MKHLTYELEGDLLEAAVAKLEQWASFPICWERCGPIIERERITVECIELEDGSYRFRCPHYNHRQRAKTYLEAAMQAYVAKMAGNEIDL